MLLNVGPTRADGIPGVDKIEIESGIVMPEVVRTLVYVLPLPVSYIYFADDVYLGSAAQKRTMTLS